MTASIILLHNFFSCFFDNDVVRAFVYLGNITLFPRTCIYFRYLMDCYG